MGLYSGMIRGDSVHEDELACSNPDCEETLVVHIVTESDTGQSYYASDCEDAVMDGCPVCGSEWKK